MNDDEGPLPINTQLSALKSNILNPVHPPKAELPILTTEGGIEIEIRLVQPIKARLPILVTEGDIVTEDSPVQPLNE